MFYLACFNSPCLHQGTCIESASDYVCNCINGYIGKNCEFLETPLQLTEIKTATTAVFLNMKFKKTFIPEYNDLSSAISLELMENYRSFVRIKFFHIILFDK